MQCQETLPLKLSLMHVQKHILHALYLNENLIIFAQLCCYNNNESAELKYKNESCNKRHKSAFCHLQKECIKKSKKLKFFSIEFE